MSPVFVVLLAFLALALGGFCKGLTGMGQALIAIPLLAPAIGVRDAVVVMSIENFVTNGAQIRRHRADGGGVGGLRALAIAGIVGTALGSMVLTELSESTLSIAVGAVVMAYVALRVLAPGLRFGSARPAVSAAVVGAAGVVQGATGVAGPVVASYLHGLRLDPVTFVYTASYLSQAFAVAQLASLLVLGLYTSGLVALAVVGLLPLWFSFEFGEALRPRLPTRAFDVVVLVLVAAAGGKAMLDGLTTG